MPFGAAGAERAARMPPERPPEQLPEQRVPVREVMKEEMQKTARLLPWMKWGEWVIMPDHFHAIIKVEGGHGTLGDVLTGFKAGVTRTLRRGDILVAPSGKPAPPDMRIWHRNYYEMIVRTPEAEKKIAEYIRMNPWRCVMDFGNGLRGMGNPSLWNAEKLGVLASRGRKGDGRGKNAAHTGNCVALSGFHSPMEKEIFEKLLAEKRPVIWCPAWGVGATFLSPGVLAALDQNRMLILEMRDCAGDLAAAEQRNRFVLEQADKLWLPHVTPGGMLDRLVREMQVQGKMYWPQKTQEGTKKSLITNNF